MKKCPKKSKILREKTQIFGVDFWVFKRFLNAIFDAETKIAIKNYGKTQSTRVMHQPTPRLIKIFEFSKNRFFARKKSEFSRVDFWVLERFFNAIFDAETKIAIKNYGRTSPPCIKNQSTPRLIIFEKMSKKIEN